MAKDTQIHLFLVKVSKIVSGTVSSVVDMTEGILASGQPGRPADLQTATEQMDMQAIRTQAIITVTHGWDPKKQ